MKKLSILLLFVGLAGCFDRQSTIITGLEGTSLPNFSFQLTDSITLLNSKSIPAGKPIVLFLFSPNCPYCKAQTAEITSKIKSLNNIHFYLLSLYPLYQIKDYYNHFQLSQYSNITIARDYDNYCGNYFKVPGVPYIAIYNKDKRLKRVLIGNVSASVIRDIAVE
jgi:thiol-disulfide isomerase/thioredoxin